MNAIKIALCQMNVVDNKSQNIQKAIEMIENAKKQGADMAVLPEMFNCPYENDKFIEYGESFTNSETLNAISKTAKLYNTSVFFDNEGKILGKHRKMHLFDIDVKGEIYFKESDTLEPGNDFTIIKTELATIGIGICYDVRFVELSRIMALEGAEILIFPGAFNLTTGPAHWELLFRSRALDNQTYAIGVAPALNKEANYHSYGHSIAVNPWGEVIEQAGFEEDMKIIAVDLNEIRRIRNELPILKNRRSDLYEINRKNK